MNELACLECDLLINPPSLDPGQRARCPRCGSTIAAHNPDGHHRALAYALAATFLLIVANLFPFLAFKSGGLEQVITLPESAGQLHAEGSSALAIIVFAFTIVAPGLLTMGLVILLGAIVLNLRVSWLAVLGRFVTFVQPWSMVEVFLIGVLVSFTKIASLATVTLGVSFWAFAGFAICLTAALACLDRHQLWRAIENAS